MQDIKLDFDVVFGVLSGKVSAAITRRLYRDFRTVNLTITPEQWVVLMSLYHSDGITQQELANRTFKDKPSITRLINNLEKQFFVVRMADKNDKRINLINITKAGRLMHEKVSQIASATMKDALIGVTEKEVKVGEILLRKIFKNLT
jgi:MarR family transcriptional regulator, organic hydroperoxide resistance regulator